MSEKNQGSEGIRLRTREPSIYSSPVLQGIEDKFQPLPSPACATCPVSMWFATRTALKCYCTRMHALVWELGNEDIHPIMECDGREIAIAALAAVESS
jgi:hypothetical protein